MTNKMSQILAILGAVALVSTVSLTVLARGAGDSSSQEGGFMQKIHELGSFLHGSAHQHDPMADLIEQLELTPDQLERLEKIHEIIGTYGHQGHGSMAELHGKLVEQFEAGHVGTDEIRQLIDEHVEQIRGMAYAVTDELIGLVNELDATQREIMLEHLQGNDGGHHSHGR